MAKIIIEYIVGPLCALFFGAMFGILTCAALSGIIREWKEKQ